MVEQSSLWQIEQQSSDFSELCNALYERELSTLSQASFTSIVQLQARIKSLSHYVKRTAHAMCGCVSPLTLDVQNASWSAKQAAKNPMQSQIDSYQDEVLIWYQTHKLSRGLVVPISLNDHIVLDSIDRIDSEQNKIRTNLHGWFDLSSPINKNDKPLLLKPTKRIMIAACAGHCWHNQRKSNPIIPTLRELLLSCSINWRNFNQLK